MKFSTRLVIIVAVMAIISGAIVGYLAYHNTREIARKSTNYRQLQTAQQTMAAVDRALYNAYKDIRIIADDKIIEERLEQAAGSDLDIEKTAAGLERDLFEKTLLTGPWDSLFIVNEEGIFNKRLIQETVNNNPEYFQEAEELDVEEIIERYFINSNKIATSGKELPNIQMGLLLGYPKKAVEDFERLAKGKNLANMLEIVPRGGNDWALLQKLINSGMNDDDGDMKKKFRSGECDGEYEIYHPETYEQAKELFYKYLPAEIAELSWKNYQCKMVYASGVYWKESTTSKEGENLIDLETDKVTLEVAAPKDGVITEILKAEGDTALAEEVLAIIDTDLLE